ncbi:diaminopimelate decarboxylase [Syntrophothermus lipocalidus]|nr:diaminopimelate decarboxylase [Syntrophothermus lipocalidus]
MRLTGTMRINAQGHLEVGGIDVLDLVREFGTPLYVLDEEGFRANCRAFRDAFAKYGHSLVIYASKTLSCLAACIIVEEEGLGLDVVSGGELYTALRASFPPERIFFHGNNKTLDELVMAVESRVGRVVVDNFYEIELLENVCERLGRTQNILLRITPGVEAHTHEYIKTGQIDSKFGFTLANGDALKAVDTVCRTKNLRLMGLHCHIGSQIFEMDAYAHATEIMVDLLAEIKNRFGLELEELNMGGGFGIYYHSGDEPRQPEEWAKAVMSTLRSKTEANALRMPKVIVEPGRAIAGPAGITLYTLGSYKEIPGVRKYVAVDGGMTDNPRPALYGSKYEAVIANRADREPDELVSVAGRCCESGDMLIWDIKLSHPQPGDILAVFATGAYNYSMSSNYNRVGRPAMVLVRDGQADLIVKRESYEDLIRNDVIPERLARGDVVKIAAGKKL